MKNGVMERQPKVTSVLQHSNGRITPLLQHSTF